MNTISTATTKKYTLYFRNKNFWQAIFAGTLLAIITGSLLNLLGIGIGLITFHPGSTQPAAFGGGTVTWLIISTAASSLIGGWFAAHVANCNKKSDGAMYGLMAWSLATIFTVMIISSGAGFFLNSTLNAVSKNYQAVNTNELPQPAILNIKGISNRSAETNRNSGQIAENQHQSTATPVAKENINNQEHPTANITITPDKAEKAAKALGSVALTTFFLLALGAIMAMWGGILGRRHEDL